VTEIPESLLRRSAEAKAKALGLPVEQVLAEMKGEAPPISFERAEPASAEETPETVEEAAETPVPAPGKDTEPEPVDEIPPATEAAVEEPEVEVESEAEVAPAPPTEAPPVEDQPAAEAEPAAAAVATAVAARAEPSGNGSGNGQAAVVSPRPVAPPKGLPEGVRTQRLLTVVKARAIQTVKAEPTDKVNTWPHLMLMEFSALLAITGLLVIMAVIIHSPLLDPANFNATPNPSKAPWYFPGSRSCCPTSTPKSPGSWSRPSPG
jgi:hypothetical protein